MRREYPSKQIKSELVGRGWKFKQRPACIGTYFSIRNALLIIRTSSPPPAPCAIGIFQLRQTPYSPSTIPSQVLTHMQVAAHGGPTVATSCCGLTTVCWLQAHSLKISKSSLSISDSEIPLQWRSSTATCMSASLSVMWSVYAKWCVVWLSPRRHVKLDRDCGASVVVLVRSRQVDGKFLLHDWPGFGPDDAPASGCRASQQTWVWKLTMMFLQDARNNPSKSAGSDEAVEKLER
ncbi:hypothetical protein IWX90DRAFT_16177 [Phyllosticta citrichinensis]|uniref:Uncharacterized protein n=1 Tax=Phyllosticta citrichinensis TaxID=1130410 RepID=A0ABR1Y608_9PEZI